MRIDMPNNKKQYFCRHLALTRPLYPRRKKSQRGSILLLAIVTTTILFILGLAFVAVSRTEKKTIASTDNIHTLDEAVETVVAKISDVLREDLFDDGKLLQGAAYDYPDENNKWLASLEPEYYGKVQGIERYYWPHITDLYEDFPPENNGIYYDPDDINNPKQRNSDHPDFSNICWVSAYSTFAKIIDHNNPIDFPYLDETASPPWQEPSWTDPQPSARINYGTRADADGDGVADARWVPIPNLFGPNGETIFTAVRIIDHGGMINLNTAYRDPSGLATTPGNWDGSHLSHINLQGIKSGSDPDVNIIQRQRYGEVHYAGGSPTFLDYGHYDNVLRYEFDVARRFLNPAVYNDGNIYHYTPFDIADELVLRNRFFLSTSAKGRFGYEDSLGVSQNWQKTLDPGPGQIGRQFPFQVGEDLGNWFTKVTPDLQTGSCNRRHICTTHNFDRILRPWVDVTANPLPSFMVEITGQRKYGILLPPTIADGTAPQAEKEEYIKQLASAIYRGLPDDPKINERFGYDDHPTNSSAAYTREELAWQYAVNLVDYQDNDGPLANGNDDEPTYITVGTTTYFGLENQTAIQRDSLFVTEIGYVDIDSSEASNLGITARKYYALELYNPASTAKTITAANDYELKIVSAGGAIKTTISLDNIGIGSIPAKSIVILVTDSTEGPDAFTTNSGPGIVGTAVDAVSLQFDDTDSILIMKTNWPSGSGQDMPADCVKVPTGTITLTKNQVQTRDRKKEIDTDTGLLLPFLWDNPGTGLGAKPTITTSPYRPYLNPVNIQLSSVGEIEKVLAIGYRYDSSNHDCRTYSRGLYSSSQATKTISDRTETGTSFDLHNYGRIDLRNSDYWGLMDFLTCFDPSNDGVDNDGIPYTSDNPTDDDFDQDKDGNDAPGATGPAAVDPDENLPQHYEQSIAGRININTAPWFVIKQLPWINLQNDASTDSDALAQAIVAFRDKLDLSSDGGPNYYGLTGRESATGITGINEDPGFTSINQLLQVINKNLGATGPDDFDIRKYLDGMDNLPAPDSPDFNGADGYTDDLEERDILFHRISNLVTVRSDVFTAYILVRIGTDGPQRRMIAIFDRSNVYTTTDKPQLLALHPVPDPR